MPPTRCEVLYKAGVAQCTVTHPAAGRMRIYVGVEVLDIESLVRDELIPELPKL